jgi:AraC family transcriptional regulator
MGAVEWGSSVSTVEVVARAAGVRPLWSVEAVTPFGLSAARWHFESLPPIGGRLPHGMLAYRAAGSAWATKAVDGRATRKRPRVGSVSFAPSDGRATWSVEGPIEVVHVYLHPRAILAVAEQLDLAGAAEIDDFFGVEDPWLAGYFQMLTSELEVRKPRDRQADPLLLDQSEHLLIRHLLRWHRCGAAREPRAAAVQPRTNPLRPTLMRRAEDYIQGNLAGDITLASLARLACMSVDHFLRSFRAASGLTPYQYVLEQRLRKASAMLKGRNTPIAAIATQCGFGNPSHFSVKFHAHYGVSPSRYRRGD